MNPHSYFERQLIGALVDLDTTLAAIGLELERIADALEKDAEPGLEPGLEEEENGA
jgi:hypothetical protein